MFEKCAVLTSVDLNGWDVSKVTDLSHMFEGCSSLTGVGDISQWATEAVADLSYMFWHCTDLTSVDFNGWDVSKVTDLSHMFEGCIRLTGVGNISQWITESAVNMSFMFSGCTDLVSVDLNGWDVSNVINERRAAFKHVGQICHFRHIPAIKVH